MQNVAYLAFFRVLFMSPANDSAIIRNRNETGAFLYRGNRILRSSSYSHGNFLLRHTRRTVPPPVCVNGPVPGRVLPDEEC
ncbi:hypothetical protein C1I94_03570 [Akkermansia muciniphila]|nr:hypothetical protein CUB89_03355 [Akkermansia muciniphila]QAA40778.1 hypothetical protein C1I94_03570 [Akkermansia muciniphila]QAA50040.1 hypothetical protein C1O47_03515 [Akkermansia muciniphila]QAA52812.1 hypothetical protein C1O50_06215 [Akkermansia muciniphila]QAA57437.1 hypothetical protein C1O54_06205 [Akkermansia muciniphila]